MSAHVERIIKILKMLPQNQKGITVSEVKERLELDHGIYVHERTIQRDMLLLSHLYYDDIDNFEGASGQAYRWFKKLSPTEGVKSSTSAQSIRDAKSDFRKKCDDIAWYLDADISFNAIKNNSLNFGMNEFFNRFAILNRVEPSPNDNKMMVFVDKMESADDLFKKAIESITKESSKIKFIMLYIDIDNSQWNSIGHGFNDLKFTAANNGINIEARSRTQNDNDRELFSNFLHAYDISFKNELITRIINKLPRKEIIEAKDNLLDVIEILEKLGKMDVFENYNEILITDFYNEWGAFLLHMAKKYLPDVKISNDAIGFYCDELSNCEEVYSLKHNSIWVFSEIHHLLCKHYEIY